MAKNTHKKSKKEQAMQHLEEHQPVVKFQIDKADFKKFIKCQVANCAKTEFNLLSGIKFKLDSDNENLILASTDGNRLLETTFKVYNAVGNFEAVYDGLYLGKLQFLKNLLDLNSGLDVLQMEMREKSLTIHDLANNICYVIPSIGHKDLQFPKYEQLFPQITEENKKEYTTIGLNIAFLKDLKNLAINERTNIVKLTFKNDSPTACILVESDRVDIASRTIIMPVEIR